MKHQTTFRLLIFLSFMLSSISIGIAQQRNSPPTLYTLACINIRYDNPNDKPNDWPHRIDGLSKLLLQEEPCIIGMQEVLNNQMQDLALRLKGYQYIGVGRLDGKEAGEYAPIWYKTSKWTCQRKGYFWLSEYPEEAGRKGWDAACERIATWAVLKAVDSPFEILVLNTHLDHVGQIARQSSEALIITRLKALAEGRPIVVMGDFNASPSDRVVQSFLSDPLLTLIDTRLAATTLKQDGTFHNFGKIPVDQQERIDYILISPQLETTSYKIISTEKRGLYLSDHNIVVAQICPR